MVYNPERYGKNGILFPNDNSRGSKETEQHSGPQRDGNTHLTSYRSRKFSVSGFRVFSGNGDIYRNLFRSKHLNKFSPQNLCRLRHFRESERLPCGIRTRDLRRRSRKKFRFFQKTGANLHPCLAVTPIEWDCCQVFIFFLRKSLFFFDQFPKIFEYKAWTGQLAHGRAGTTAEQFFLKKTQKSLSICRKILNIRYGRFFQKRGERFTFFCVCTGRQRGGIKNFYEKLRFLLSVCRKNLNKGDEVLLSGQVSAR